MTGVEIGILQSIREVPGFLSFAVVFLLLFVREHRREGGRAGGVTEPFRCLGFARYESHQGERPMAIRWRLEQATPAGWMQGMGLAV